MLNISWKKIFNQNQLTKLFNLNHQQIAKKLLNDSSYSFRSRFIAKSILRTARGCHVIRIPGALAALSQRYSLDTGVGARTSLVNLLGSSKQSAHSVTAGDLPSSASNLSHLQQSTHDTTG